MTSADLENANRLGQKESGDGIDARRERMREGDYVHARICRFDPTRDAKPRYDSYKVPYSRLMRVLDVLNYISEELEEDLAYRWFCGVKKCGTCAVRVNGREVLACWEAAEPEMIIEPLRHAPVVRDLVVDRTDYERLVTSMVPWLERTEPYSGFPERLSHLDMKPVATALDCLSCLACFSACPVLDLGAETNFSGPAPLVQFAQVALDPRDGMNRGQMSVDLAGIFNCVSCYKCEEACPVGIPIVSEIIEPLKAKAYRQNESTSRHSKAFESIIFARGKIDPSELVLRTQGLRAAARIVRILKLLFRGKINPIQTLFGKAMPDLSFVRRIFEITHRGPADK
ncbi:MAG: 2Fe-2S iron-sulfur cluster-binding protein [Xanthobacteraceae bacterium]